MILKKDNIERIAENESYITKLKAEGFEEVVAEIGLKEEKSTYEGMKAADLKALCDEKGIEYTSRTSKEELVKLLNEKEDSEGAE